MMDKLEKIFGSVAKVKIMRLFLFNPSTVFDLEEIGRRSMESPTDARHEVTVLEKIGIVKRRSFFKDHKIGKGKNRKIERIRTSGWILNDAFEYLKPMQSLLIHVSPLGHKEIIRRINKVGKLKLVIVAGVFIQNWDSRVDILIVGDNLRKGTLDTVMKTIESEIGREIKYASFETADFQYRFSMYDKLIRDILDYQHEKILDRIGIVEKTVVS